jgi:glycerophosphoryl diester phosphodiesterase
MKNSIAILFIILVIGLFSCGTEKSIITVTAHRGASGLAPENTLSSVKKAMALGADFSEIDVQETADGQLILLHDGTLDRTSNSIGSIWEMKYADLKDVDVGTWFSAEFVGEPISTLEEIIDAVNGKMKLNIELKMNGHQKKLTELTVDLVTKKNFIDQCIMTSFDREAVRKVKQINPKIKTGYIFSKFPESEDIYKGEFDLFSINKKLVTQELVDKAHQNGKEVHVWTVNKKEDMKTLIGYGVDSIITNYPNILIEILKGE